MWFCDWQGHDILRYKLARMRKRQENSGNKVDNYHQSEGRPIMVHIQSCTLEAHLGGWGTFPALKKDRLLRYLKNIIDSFLYLMK